MQDQLLDNVTPIELGKVIQKNVRDAEDVVLEKLTKDVPQACLPLKLDTKQKILMNCMIIGSYISTLSLAFQAYQIYQNHDDLSGFFVPTWAMYAFSALVWFLYTLWVMSPTSIWMQISALLAFVCYVLILIMLFVF
jgi:vacuolar-type H+-ATPase subunit I/STV1